MPAAAGDRQAELLRAFLAERDVACPGCGYNLRGLTGDACPECHETIHLGVVPGDTAWGTLVGTIVALSIAAGMAGVVAGFSLFMTMFRNGPHPSERFVFMYYPAATFVLTVVPVNWLMCASGRRWFRSRAPATRGAIRLAAITVSSAIIGGWLVALSR